MVIPETIAAPSLPQDPLALGRNMMMMMMVMVMIVCIHQLLIETEELLGDRINRMIAL